jgi:hypothetical protein
LSVSGPEREAFHLWMSSHEKVGPERVTVQKQAIASLKRLLDLDPRSQPYLKSTVRKWNGVVALEQSNWIEARFEFLQGRTIAEKDDPGSTAWFDAAITETEVWEAFTSPALSLASLGELPDKLDQASTLYSAAADRSNAEFASDWAQWIKILVDPSVPARSLAERILSYVERRTPVGEPEIEPPVKQLALQKCAFAWNRFWLSKAANETQSSLKTTFKLDASLEALTRGAAVLAVPPADFASLLQDASTEGPAFAPDSAGQLLKRMQADLEHLRALETGARQYVAEVGMRLDASPQRRKDVVRAVRPGKLRK